MHVLPLSRVFRRHSSSLPTAAALDEEGLKIGAALAWISHHGNLDDFPGSRNERLALMTTAIRRGLAAWDRGHDRYQLTRLGKMQASCYPPNIKWTRAPAQDAPAAKRDLGVRLLEGFESRPYTMIAAFFAVGVAVGAAAAWVPSSSPSDPQSALSATSRTSGESAAPAVSDDHSAPGSPVATPQDPPKEADVPAPPATSVPASPPRNQVVSTGSAAEPMAPQQTQASDPTPPPSAHQEERLPTATISGSVAATRPIGHFDRSPSTEPTEPPASTNLLDSLAIPAPKGVREAQPKPSRHRGRDARTQHAGADRAPTWSQDGDDGGRSMLAPHARRGPNVAEQSLERGASRYRRYRNFPPYGDDPEPDGDPMGLVGWLFR
jgi:hypothetical protein